MNQWIPEYDVSELVISPEHEAKELKQKEMLTFNGAPQFCCVSFIDIVHSTKTVSTISEEKLGLFYSIFLNTISSIITNNGGIVVKNIGDAILYYFAVIKSEEECILKSIRCNQMIKEKRIELNELLTSNKLPRISFRISSDFGKIFIALSAISRVSDIFGTTVNMCAKINSLGDPNTAIIGNDTYIRVKSIHTFKFNELKSKKVNILKNSYPTYVVEKS